jgi:hypothetical protein
VELTELRETTRGMTFDVKQMENVERETANDT